MTEPLPPVLVVMALPVEAQGLFERESVRVLYTGLGKVNAAMSLTRRLLQYVHAGLGPPLVVNFGTAGSRRFDSHSLVGCASFVQRDMDVTGLGFERGETPFEDIPARLEFPPIFMELPHGVCGTGDSFEVGRMAHPWDVIDMEAYALAKVCRVEGARFGCAKYITDGADHQAGDDWQQNLPRAAAEFLRLYRQLIGS